MAAPEPEPVGAGAAEPDALVVAGGVSSSECCSATGVSHSLGRQRSRNGTMALTEASRFTQEGISRPVSSCGRRHTSQGGYRGPGGGYRGISRPTAGCSFSDHFLSRITQSDDNSAWGRRGHFYFVFTSWHIKRS